MKRPIPILTAVLAISIAALASPSHATLFSGSSLFSNGHRTELTEQLTRTESGYLYRARGANGFSFDAVAVTNLQGNTVSFLFTFTFPIVAPNVFVGALNKLTADVTDTGDNGASALIHGTNSKLAWSTANLGATDLGIAIGEDCIDPAGGGQTAHSAYTDVSSVFAPTAFTSFTTHLEFDMSALDKAAMVGHTELLAVDAVPEPGTLALMATGLGTLLAGIRRRK